ncbi:hypothetical protein B566_EDAN013927 [Ephemera danica]|nr:hypothetical protein B566_EDAN013927 [Ephemera danica]
MVLCYSAAATHQGRVLDLSPGAKYEARCSAPVRRTLSIKVSINGLGGVHVLLPILQMACSPSTTDVASYSPDLAPPPLLQRRNSTTGLGRRVSDLLRNVLTRSPGNQDNLLKNNGVGIVGDMLTKVRPRLIDVHVLMAVQLLVEMARDTPNQLLLRALHHHILFNFHIWARSQFHIRIVQFVLDTVRQFHGSSLSAATASEGPDVCLEGAPTPDDARTLRGALLGLVKYYLQKEVNVIEVLEMLTSHIESASCRDQLLLLLYEPQAAETLYCLLLDRNFSHTLKHKVLKLFSVLLRSERVYERHKTRLRLQDATLPNVGLYPGVLSLLDASDFTMELAVMLLDQILLTGTHRWTV